MESNIALVFKVNYGGVLRRFSVPVNVNGQLDLDISGLREKIVRLFNLPADADFTLTYIDEDGDVVTLADDSDLLDVLGQRLKFLKINVQLNSVKTANSYAAESSGNVTPVGLSNTDIHKGINDILVAVPESLRDTISKISVDLASRAVCMSPVVGEVLESLSKLGKVARAQEIGPSSPAVSNSSGDGGLLPKLESTKVHISSSHGEGKDNSRENQNKKHPATPDDQSGCDAQKSAFHASSSSGVGAGSNECPFSGTSLNNGPKLNQFRFTLRPPHPCYSKKSHCIDHRTSTGFHRGIRCDGCGVLPITGPRFKSKVKEDYDLCSFCFSRMGNETDYVRLDRPVMFRDSQHFGGSCAPAQNPLPIHPAPPFFRGGLHFKSRSKLDSRFVLDVNVLDGTVMAPSALFTKIWRMRNNGSLVWPRGTQLIWIGGDRFSDSISVDLEIPGEGVPVDGELDIAVDFIAPGSPGRYISYWRMASSYGAKFGQRVWVLIHVDASLRDSASNKTQGFDLNAALEADSSKGSMSPRAEWPSAPVDNSLSVGEVNSAIPPNNLQALSSLSTSYPFIDPEIEVSNTSVDNILLVEEVTAAIPPSTTQSPSSPSTSYPIIDLTSHGVSSVESTQVLAEGNKEKNEVEQTLLRELEEMGFKQIDLNKEILRKNDYNLEQSVDALCGDNEWDPILEELQEMGFCDEEKNKRLLKKNKGSIKRVVMDLLTGDKA